MPKRLNCDLILEPLFGDPRIRTAPLAARALWVELLWAMTRLGSSVLRFGSRVPEPAEIALLVSASVTDVQTQLETLIERGLLVRADDGAIAAPVLEAALKRAETARINGAKGGRPRKLREPDGQQREILMPVGKPPAETQGETHAGTHAASLLTSGEEEESKEASQQAARVSAQAARLAGVTSNPRVVAEWLGAGADEPLILGTVRSVLARGGPTPGSLRYFTPAVLEAAAKERPFDEAGYIAAMSKFAQSGMQGEMPRRADYRHAA